MTSLSNDAHGGDLADIHARLRDNCARMARTTSQERIARLTRLRNALWESRTELHEALYADFRKNPAEADMTEVHPVLSEVNHTIRHLPRWMRPDRVKTPRTLLGTHSAVQYQPKGLVLILAPWNYPVNLTLCPLIAAIAAGNCVIIKPSSKVPHTVRYLKKLLAAVFPPEEVVLVEGSSRVADELLRFRFDHIFFTGSPTVGRHVMRAAAEHLTPVTLELGGKSPAIVDETADLAKAAERIMWGKFLNAGQTCVAPDYVMIQAGVRDAFLDAARRVLKKWYGSTPDRRRASDSYCRIVSDGRFQHLQKLLNDSVAAGATVAFGGAADAAERYMEPTLLADVTMDSPIMAGEIFGPILPVMTFASLDEPIAVVRGMEKPLALYFFSSSEEAVARIRGETTSGGACINSVIIHVANPNLPFGGVGRSGMGNYHGLYGFRTFSHERAVLRQGRPDSLRFFYPPYTRCIKRIIRFAARHSG
ncbi:aldehyde dehydrogenase family protein [bacterium]|nr:aldehyde dehydrogenase family protein [candidate division CSSED10-310 bacterium]